ncbi:MAG: hypothetical protein RIS47_1631 [Bacteroidota bacterium]|jgi:hypothetical protein
MRKLLVIILLSLPSIIWAQTDYPYSILPGQNKAVQSASDTLWVMKHSQMQKAIFAAKENKLLKEQIAVLTDKVSLLDKATSVRDTTLNLTQQDVNHYKQQWLDCDKDLQTVVKKYKKQRFAKNVALLGTVVGFVAGALIF